MGLPGGSALSVTVTTESGPNDIEFVYYRGVHDSDARFTKTKTVLRAALASGALTKESEKADLMSEVEQMHANYLATQE
jgi:hypothetical protein